MPQQRKFTQLMGKQPSPSSNGGSAVGPAPAPNDPAPPLTSAPTHAHLVDSIVCVAAEAMQTTPQAMRPGLKAAFERVVALGLTAEQVLGAMAPAHAVKGKGKGA